MLQVPTSYIEIKLQIKRVAKTRRFCCRPLVGSVQSHVILSNCLNTLWLKAVHPNFPTIHLFKYGTIAHSKEYDAL